MIKKRAFFVPLPLFFFLFSEFLFFNSALKFKASFFSNLIDFNQKIEKEIKIKNLEKQIEITKKNLEKIKTEEIKIKKERIKRADNKIGIYVPYIVAVSEKLYYKNLRKKILSYLDKKLINCLVIDVKEAEGPKPLSKNLSYFLKEAKSKNAWLIARIVVFRDNSKILENPDLYLKTKKNTFFQDNQNCYWLDPEKSEVLDYIFNFSKKVINFGFDEIQFDYIRFPSDGNIQEINFNPEKSREEIISIFTKNLISKIRNYNQKIVLSVDLFGYIASQFKSTQIGQNLNNFLGFDFLSFMLYPSHFYGGFYSKTFKIYFPYKNSNIKNVVSNHPYEVVFYSLSETNNFLKKQNKLIKIRPWLQAFDLESDTKRGIFYNKEKISLEILGAKNASSSGYLFWNPKGEYNFLDKNI